MDRPSELFDEVAEVVREVFAQDDMILAPEMTADDILGWDSFKHIELIMAVEAKFMIKLSTREIDRLNSIQDLVSTIRSKRLRNSL